MPGTHNDRGMTPIRLLLSTSSATGTESHQIKTGPRIHDFNCHLSFVIGGVFLVLRFIVPCRRSCRFNVDLMGSRLAMLADDKVFGHAIIPTAATVASLDTT